MDEAFGAAQQLDAEVKKPEGSMNWKSIAEWGNTLLGIAGKATDLTEKLAPHLPWLTIDAYTKLASADPGAAYAGLTRVYLRQKRTTDAYAAVNKAIELAPKSPDVHVALAEVYYRQGKIIEADRELVTVVNSGARTARAYLDLARIAETASYYARAKTKADAIARGAASRLVSVGEMESRSALLVLKEVVRRVGSMPGQRSVIRSRPVSWCLSACAWMRAI